MKKTLILILGIIIVNFLSCSKNININDNIIVINFKLILIDNNKNNVRCKILIYNPYKLEITRIGITPDFSTNTSNYESLYLYDLDKKNYTNEKEYVLYCRILKKNYINLVGNDKIIIKPFIQYMGYYYYGEILTFNTTY